MVGGICEYPPCALTLDAGPIPDSPLNTPNAQLHAKQVEALSL